jgi:hypothetical protein
MSRLRYVVACALAIIPFVIASAIAAPNAADAQKITACLETAGTKDTSGVECIGIIADPCIAAASQKDSFSTDQKACAARELAVWTARIASHTQSISRNGKSFIAAVTAAQKSLSDSIAKLCPIYDKLDPGLVPGGSAYCRLQITAMWALQLDRLVNAASPH